LLKQLSIRWSRPGHSPALAFPAIRVFTPAQVASSQGLGQQIIPFAQRHQFCPHLPDFLLQAARSFFFLLLEVYILQLTAIQ